MVCEYELKLFWLHTSRPWSGAVIVLLLPQTAGGVAEHDRGVQLEFVLIVKVSAAPARVRDDHSVGHAA